MRARVPSKQMKDKSLLYLYPLDAAAVSIHHPWIKNDCLTSYLQKKYRMYRFIQCINEPIKPYLLCPLGPLYHI